MKLKENEDFIVRNFSQENEDEIIKLWNHCLSKDPITKRTFREKTFLDPDFDSNGALVAEKEKTLIGFTLAVVRKIPNNGRGLEEDRGWITAIFVRPEYQRKGVGATLLQKALDFFRSQKRQVVYVCGLSGSAPNYFFPGVDIQMYGGALEFFKKYGFKVDHEAISMKGLLVNFKIPDKTKNKEEQLKREGIIVQFLESEYDQALLFFLSRYFPGDWHKHTRQLLESNVDRKRFFIALKSKEVIGYCHYKGEHFGPFGVSPKYRRKGIGAVIFLKCTEKIHKDGGKKVWLYWADEPVAAEFYRGFGLKEIRRYAIMKKTLGNKPSYF